MQQEALTRTHLLSLKDLQAAERHGVRKAVAIQTKLQRRIFGILRSGQVPMDFTQQIADMLREPILEAVQTADLLGRKRGKITANRTGFKLDIHSAAVKAFDRQEALEAKGAHEQEALSAIQGFAQEIEQKIRDEVREAILQGEPLAESKKRLMKTFNRLGITPSNKGQIEQIVRTQTQMAFSAGRWKVERLDPDIDEMLWGYKYVTAGDNRVRPEHANLDGVVLPKDHAFWDSFMPPNGYNCRCQAIPLYDRRPVQFPPREAEPDRVFNFNPGRIIYGQPAPRAPQAPVDVPVETPNIDTQTATLKAWKQGSGRDDVRRLLRGEDVSDVAGERARALLKLLADAALNPVTLYRGEQDHRSGIMEFTERKMKDPIQTLSPNTVRAIKISKYNWIADVRENDA
jgi:SPP1 gp7 family putative phage head morphogenesis protein